MLKSWAKKSKQAWWHTQSLIEGEKLVVDLWESVVPVAENEMSVSSGLVSKTHKKW